MASLSPLKPLPKIGGLLFPAVATQVAGGSLKNMNQRIPAYRSPTPSNPSAVSPNLNSPAAKTYIQNQSQTPQSPVDNTAQANDIKTQLADLEAKKQALITNNFTDTNQLQKTGTNQYAPSNYENAKGGFVKAYEDYIQTLNPSSEVMNAQSALNQYTSDKNTALQNISDQTIPMRFVTGQQKSVEARAQNQQNFLQGNIGIAQSNQTARQNAGLARVSLREKLLGLESSPAEQAKAEAEGKKSQFEMDMTQKKFDEDKRQFGLQYALEQQKLSASGAGGSEIDNAVAKQNALQNAADIQTVNSNYQTIQAIAAKVGKTPQTITLEDIEKLDNTDLQSIGKSLSRIQTPEIARTPGGDAANALEPVGFIQKSKNLATQFRGKLYDADKVLQAIKTANSIVNNKNSGGTSNNQSNDPLGIR